MQLPTVQPKINTQSIRHREIAQTQDEIVMQTHWSRFVVTKRLS
jgi:hypothetical protein